MRVVLDGSVCFDRFGACYNYHMQLVPRLLEQGVAVTVTPSPTGALDALQNTGAQVTQTILPRGSWLPNGPLRQFLSRQKRKIEAWRWNRRLEQSGERMIFQSFYYGLPPNPNTVFVTMVLDLIQEKFPEWYGSAGALKETKAECVRRAARIIAISEATRRDVIEYYRVDPAKVDVVYLGIHSSFDSPLPHGCIEAMRKRVGEKPFLLQVGGRDCHKNFDRLLDAFALYSSTEEIDLVSAGEAWSEEEVAKIDRLGLKNRVRLVHRPDQNALVALYRLAAGLVYPSLYEGFGLPPVEAMVTGIPVAASTGGSVPEIVGDAAALFDPTSVDSMLQAIRRIRDPKQAAELCRRGKVRAQLFTWDKIAQQTAEVYRRALQENPPDLLLNRKLGYVGATENL